MDFPATVGSATPGSPLRDEELDRLLGATSRTFALSIPLLPEPTRREVGLAYLLFRIADTLEDAEVWPPGHQVAALGEFAALLDEPTAERANELSRRWLDPPPLDHAGYLELLAALPQVMASYAALRPEARRLIGQYTARTAQGMAQFVSRRLAGGPLQLVDLPDLSRYCYVVAGIVGEMLTELFLLGRDGLGQAARFLRQKSAQFGEALQLVNILKDSGVDATHGRRFLPAEVERGEVFALARRDLEDARSYVQQLQQAGAPRGIVAFTALPVRMAIGSLLRLETHGPGAKLSRAEVFAIVSEMNQALDSGAPAV